MRPFTTTFLTLLFVVLDAPDCEPGDLRDSREA
jgi:hypothetical protein